MSGLQIFGLVAFIMLAIVAVGFFVFTVLESLHLIKDRRGEVPYDLYSKKILCYASIFTLSFTLMLVSIYMWNGINPVWYKWIQSTFGGLFFGACISIGTATFIIHYYGKNLPSDFDKKLFKTLMVCVALVGISFLVVTDGFADLCGEKFLLPKGISFDKGFVRPDSPYGANIAFYAICILSGAVFVYFLCDHKLYMKYGKHGMVESTFFIAFPAGIIGARIAYVIGNWSREFAGKEFWHVFAIWEGGLTILGGAIVGIVVGMLWFSHVNGKDKLMDSMDIIFPTILIAQAIGRWGNFFNCEVHGVQMNADSWLWLPRIVFNNAQYSSVNGWADPGKIYVPLFLIEAMSNMLGYFVLAHLFGNRLHKYCKPGDLLFGYITWYGLTRTLMEPLRDKGFNMGSNGYWSWIWSIVFVAAGVLLILINHLVRNIIDKKKNNFFTNVNSDIIGGGITLVIGIAGIIVGAIMMASNSFAQELEFNNFNIGVIILVLGCSSLLASFIPLSKIVIDRYEYESL